MAWVRTLQALGQTGLHFSQDPYDRDRYQQVLQLAADILSRHTSIPRTEIQRWHNAEFGYATPKVDVRGVIFKEDQLLLVQEKADADRWTLPGGWADVNESPSEAVEREVLEETGLETQATKLLAVYDREKQGHAPPFPYHVYKMFFLCRTTGGAPAPQAETSDLGFFSPERLPELSVSRVTETQLKRFLEHHHHPDWPTDFD